jgi:hypothetical protein
MGWNPHLQIVKMHHCEIVKKVEGAEKKEAR